MFQVMPQDAEIAKLYRDFLPDTIFDAHVHLHGTGTVPSATPGGVFSRSQGTMESYLEDMRHCYPGVHNIGINCFPMPDKAMNQKRELRSIANDHISSVTSKIPDATGCA